MTTESGSLARIGPAGPRVKQDIIPDPPHPRDEREQGWQPIDLVDVGDEFALCYEYDDDGDGWMYTHKAFEGWVHAVHRDGGDLVVMTRDNYCDPADQSFYVYNPNRFESCNWNEYDEGWRDEWVPENGEHGENGGKWFGSPVAHYKGEENVPTEWWVIKD